MSHRRLSREVREPQMLAAAVAAFAEHGFHAASMDDIAARAGVSKPMIYAYLGTKEDLFVACMHREGTRLMQAIVDVVDPALRPEDQLWRGMRAFFMLVASNPDGWAVLHRRAAAPFGAQYASMRARMVEVVEGMLGRAVRGRGRVARPDEITTLAYALIGVGESLADWLVDNPAVSAEALAGRCMGIVWPGVGSLLDGGGWRPRAGAAGAEAGS